MFHQFNVDIIFHVIYQIMLKILLIIFINQYLNYQIKYLILNYPNQYFILLHQLIFILYKIMLLLMFIITTQ